MVQPLPAGPKTERARELFFREGHIPHGQLPAHIVRSWLRSRPLERDRVEIELLARDLLDQRREQAAHLLRLAQPELDGLAEHVAASGCVVALSDASGIILEEVGSPDFMPKAQRVALRPGADWSEAQRGTNAIGTALAEGDALTVLGAEHYLDPIGILGCAAAPIFSGRGEMAGALDISGDALRIDMHALGLVRMAAQQVEHRMTVGAATSNLLRFHVRPGLIGTAREALLAVDGGRIVAANRIALNLLRCGWADVLDIDVEAVLGARWRVLQNQRGLLTLPGGQQIAAQAERASARVVAMPSDEPRDDAPAPRAVPTAMSPEDDVIAPLLTQAVRVLDAGVSILVTGETGVGKDVFARGLHAASRRAQGPLVAIDCASLPEGLIEAELFGYEEGAYTGARRKGALGRIREADGGLLFLDEIGDMPLALQSRLLRVLEERRVVPLGGGRAQAVDFDLVCATHGDLPALMAQGRFRADLMYRVAGYEVHLPALRERSDRRQLILRLWGDAGRTGIAEAALDILVDHHWPGNVRELRSVLRTLAALSTPGQRIGVDDLPPQLRGPVDSRAAAPAVQASAAPTASLEITTRQAIDQALAQCGGHVAAAARLLGVHRSTLYRHLERKRQHDEQ